MGDLVELDAQRPHLAGPARCCGCGHRWVSVVDARADLQTLECPGCSQPEGQLLCGEECEEPACAPHRCPVGPGQCACCVGCEVVCAAWVGG